MLATLMWPFSSASRRFASGTLQSLAYHWLLCRVGAATRLPLFIQLGLIPGFPTVLPATSGDTAPPAADQRAQCLPPSSPSECARRRSAPGSSERGDQLIAPAGIDGCRLRRQHFRDPTQIGEQRLTHFFQRLMAGTTADADGLARLAPFQNHPVPVLARAQQFIAAHLRRIGQRAPHQEQIQETRLHRIHADRREQVDIQRTHFDIFDTAAQQRV